jgi:aminopeptidase N
VKELISALDKPSFALIIEARQFIQIAIAQALKASWYLLHQRIHQNDAYIKKPCTLFDMNAAGLRRLYEVYYSYQYHLDFEATKNSLVTLFNQQLDKNMTHTTAALNLLAQMGCDDELDNALQQFYTRWQDDTHAINYWLRIQAALHSPTVISRVNELLEHPAFNVLNPNKVYALLGTFMNNPYGCLDPSGKGYELIAEMILALDKINPPLAAKLLVKLSSWQRLEDQQLLIKKQLVRIQMNAQSNDVKNCALHN